MPQQIVLNPVPCALIAGLLLTPYDLPGLRIAIDFRFELVMRKRIQLLQPYDGYIGDTALAACRA